MSKDGTFSIGILFNKEKSRKTILRKNDYWYKCLIVDYLCLIGEDSMTHRKAATLLKKKRSYG